VLRKTSSDIPASPSLALFSFLQTPDGQAGGFDLFRTEVPMRKYVIEQDEHAKPSVVRLI
jgi:hypothetical protein